MWEDVCFMLACLWEDRFGQVCYDIPHWLGTEKGIADGRAKTKRKFTIFDHRILLLNI